MAIKLDELIGWKAVSRGEHVTFSSERTDPRKVRLHLSCEGQTWLYATYEALSPDGEIIKREKQYIATAGPGVETVEFYVSGDVQVDFSVNATEGHDQIWINTAEAEPNVSANPNAVSFTEPMERVARDPHQEHVMAVMRQSEKRREKQMLLMIEQNNRAVAALDAERERLVAQAETAQPASQPSAQSPSGSGTGPQGSSEGAGSGNGGS